MYKRQTLTKKSMDKIGNPVIFFYYFSGTVLRRWHNLSADNKCDIELFLKANSIIVTNEQRNSIAVTQELVSSTRKGDTSTVTSMVYW